MKKKHEEDHHSTCDSCGATVYKEHLDQGIARYADGKLLCPPCLTDFEKAEEAAAASGMGALAPIEFDDDEDDDDVQVDMTSSRIHQASAATLGMSQGWDDTKYKRPLDSRAIAATRCRSFHSKLTDSALVYMNDQINEWLDKNDVITIKFSNSTIGVFEGKSSEAHIIVTVFY